METALTLSSALALGALAVFAAANPAAAQPRIVQDGASAHVSDADQGAVSVHANAGSLDDDYSGVGGPFELVEDYPPCTAQRRDRCIQSGRSDGKPAPGR